MFTCAGECSKELSDTVSVVRLKGGSCDCLGMQVNEAKACVTVSVVVRLKGGSCDCLAVKVSAERACVTLSVVV